MLNAPPPTPKPFSEQAEQAPAPVLPESAPADDDEMNFVTPWSFEHFVKFFSNIILGPDLNSYIFFQYSMIQQFHLGLFHVRTMNAMVFPDFVDLTCFLELTLANPMCFIDDVWKCGEPKFRREVMWEAKNGLMAWIWLGVYWSRTSGSCCRETAVRFAVTASNRLNRLRCMIL